MSNIELVQQVLKLIQQARHIMHRNSLEVWTNFDFTVPQLKTLFFIHFHGTTNIQNIAKKFGVTPSNMTRIVDRLVKHGFVKREESPTDRRMYELRITEKGENTIGGMREKGVEYLSEVFEKLRDEDLVALIRLLSLLIEVAEAEARDN